MPYEMVWHGVVCVSPHVALFAPAPETKMPFVYSPSMPSQLSSFYVASGVSVADGA